MTVKKIIIIKGKVQGVGFRESMCEKAKQLGVTGWVRNKKDGSVEAYLHGESTLVEELISWANKGPPHANVESVITESASSGDALRNFIRKPTE